MKTSLFPSICLLAVLMTAWMSFPLHSSAQSGFEAIERNVERIYVPEDHLEFLTHSNQQGALIPLSQLNELLEKWEQSQKGERPYYLTIETADYDITRQAETALISAKLLVKKLGNNPEVLPLNFGSASVESATLNDQPAPLTQLVVAPQPAVKKGKSKPVVKSLPALMLIKQGEYQLTLQFSIPLKQQGLRHSVDLKTPRSVSGNISVALNESESLRWNQHELPAEWIENLQATLPAGMAQNHQLTWLPKQERSSSGQLLFAQNSHLLQLEPGTVQWTTNILLNRYGQPAQSQELMFSKDFELTSIQAEDLSRWEFVESDHPDYQKIRLEYHSPIASNSSIRLTCLRTLEENDRWIAPVVDVIGASSQVNQLAILSSPLLRLELTAQQNVEASPWINDDPIHLTLPQQESSGKRRFAFKAFGTDYQLEVELLSKARRISAALKSQLTMTERQLIVKSACTISTEFAPVSEFRFSLPNGWRIDTVMEQDQKTDFRIIDSNDSHYVILLNLKTLLQPGETRSLFLEYSRNWEPPTAQKPAEFSYPELSPHEVNVLEGEISLVPASHFEPQPQKLVSLTPTQSTQSSHHFSYQYQDSSFEANWKVFETEASVSAQSILLANVERSRIEYTSLVDCQVLRSGIQSVVVTLSNWPGDVPQFQTLGSNHIKQQTVLSQEPLKVQLRFDQRIQGQIVLMAKSTAAYDTNWSLPVLSVENVAHQTWYQIINALDEVVVQSTEDNEQFQYSRVDLADLPNIVANRASRPVWASRTLTSDSLQFESRIASNAALPMAMIEQASLETLLTESGQLQHIASVSLKATQAQSILFRLPQKAFLWSAELNGKPVPVQRSASGDVIPLSGQESRSDHSHEVRLVYAMPAAESQQNLALEVPEWEVITSKGQRRGVELLEQNWTIYHAPSQQIETTTNTIETLTSHEQPGFIETLWNRLRLESLIVLALISSAIFGALLIINWLINRVSKIVGYLATFILVPATVLCAIGLMLPSIQLSDIGSSITTSSQFDSGMEMATSQPHYAGADVDISSLDSYQKPNYEYSAETDSFDRKADANKSKSKAVFESDIASSEFVDDFMANHSSQPGFADVQLNAVHDELFIGKPTSTSGVRSRYGRTDKQAEMAKLSIPIDLTVPQHFHTSQFRLRSQNTQKQPLQFQIVDDSQRQLSKLLFTTLTIILLSLLALKSFRNAVCAAVTIVAITLLLGQFESLPQTGIDGLFSGALAMFFLILGVQVLLTLKRWCECCARMCLPKLRSSTTAAALLVTTGVLSQVAFPQLASAQASKSTPNSKPVVILPYSSLENPLDATTVYVPEKLYKKLTQAKPDGNQPQSVLISGMVCEIDLQQLKQDTTHVLATAKLYLHSTVSTPQAVTLPLNPKVLTEALLDGKPTQLKVTTHGIDAIIASEGLHELSIQFLLPIQQQGESGSLVLTTKQLPAGMLQVKMPAENLSVVSKPTPSHFIDEQKSTLQVGLSSNTQHRISWRPPLQRQGSEQLSSTARIETQINNRGLETLSRFTFRLSQGEFETLRWEIPEQLQLKSVTGSHLQAWKREGRELTVTIQPQTRQQTEILIATYQPHENTGELKPIEFQSLIPLETPQCRGEWFCSILKSHDLQIAASENLSRINLQKTKQQSSDLVQAAAFRFSSPDFTAQLTPILKRRSLSARAAIKTLLEPSVVQTRLKFMLNLSGEVRSYLSFELEEGYQPLTVVGTMVSDWYLQTTDGKRRLIVEFESPQQRQVELAISGKQLRNNESLQQKLLLPRWEENQNVSCTWDVMIGSQFESVFTPSPQWNDAGFAPSQVIAQQQKAAPRQKPSSIRRFRSGHLDGHLDVQLTRKECQLDLSTLTIIAIQDEMIDYGTTFQITPRQGEYRSIVIQVPSQLQGKWKFEHDQIQFVQQINSTSDKWTAYRLTFRQPISTALLISASVSINQTEAGMLSIPKYSIQFTSQQGAIRTLQQSVVLLSLGRRPVEILQEGSAKPLTASELKLNLPEPIQQQAMVIYELGNGALPQVELQTAPQEQASPLRVTLSEYWSQLQRDGSWITRCVWMVKNHQQQQFPVQLPGGSRLLSVKIEGRLARASQTADNESRIEIPIPPKSVADLAFPVEIIVQGQLTDWKPVQTTGSQSQVSLPLPHPGKLNTGEEIVPIRTLWHVSLPKGWVGKKLTDPESSNMEDVAGESKQYRMGSYLNEAMELTRQLSSSKLTIKQRTRAKYNLKRLNITLNDQSNRRYIQTDDLKSQLNELNAAQQKFENEPQGKAGALYGDANINGVIIDSINGDIVTSNSATFTIDERLNRDWLDSGTQVELQLQVTDEESTPAVPNIRQPNPTRGLQVQSPKQQGIQRRQSREMLQQGNNFYFDNNLGYTQSPGARQLKEAEQLFEEKSLNKRFKESNVSNDPFGLPMPADDNIDGITNLIVTEELDFQEMEQEEIVLPAIAGMSTQALSLPVTWNFEGDSDQLTFTKIGGSPQLTLSIQSEQTTEFRKHLLEAGIGFLILMIGLLMVCAKRLSLTKYMTLVAFTILVLLIATTPVNDALCVLVAIVCGAVFILEPRANQDRQTV